MDPTKWIVGPLWWASQSKRGSWRQCTRQKMVKTHHSDGTSVTPMRHTSLGTNAQMMVMMQSFRSSAEKKWRKNGLVGCCATLYMRVARTRWPSTYNIKSFTPFSNLPIQSLFHSHASSYFLQFLRLPTYFIKRPCPHQNSRHSGSPVENCRTCSEIVPPGLLESNLIVVLVPNTVSSLIENCLTWKKGMKR